MLSQSLREGEKFYVLIRKLECIKENNLPTVLKYKNDTKNVKHSYCDCLEANVDFRVSFRNHYVSKCVCMCFFFCNAKDQTHGLTHARQALLLPSYIPSPTII